MFKMSKKGAVVQLHWIFIIIAGGLILAFFFSVATKQNTLSDEKMSLSLVQSVDMIFELADSGEQTSQIVAMPKKGVSFLCNKACDCFFQTGSARKSFGSQIIFSEEEIDSPEVIVWSIPWKTPFRITNLLLVSDPETRKIIVYDDSSFSRDLENKINSVLPDNIILEKLSLNNLVYDNSKKTRIFVVQSSDSLISLPDGFDNAFVEVIIISNTGRINFYEKEKGDDELKIVNSFSYPYDIVWILSSMFSSDSDMFFCGMKSAFKRLNLVSMIFKNRAEFLSDKTLEMNMGCDYPVDAIDSFIDLTESPETKSYFELSSDISQINVIKPSIKNSNDRLIGSSCPELY